MTNPAILIALLGVPFASAAPVAAPADPTRAAMHARLLAGYAAQAGVAPEALPSPAAPPVSAAVEYIAENDSYLVQVRPRPKGELPHHYARKFEEVLARHRADGHENDPQWKSLLKDARDWTKGDSPLEVLYAIHHLVNRWISYRTDIQRYKVADYWATPMEALDGQKGDCEDFAIIKYLLLREVLPEARAYIAVSNVPTSMTSSGGHANLLVVIDSGAYSLNNNGAGTIDAFSDVSDEVIYLSGFNETENLIFVMKPRRK